MTTAEPTDLEEIAAARAERKELLRELDSYGELHAEFQRLEVLAREEGRRQALIETGQALADELNKLRARRQKVETAPKLDLEVSAALEERREELELVDAQLEAKRDRMGARPPGSRDQARGADRSVRRSATSAIASSLGRGRRVPNLYPSARRAAQGRCSRCSTRRWKQCAWMGTITSSASSSCSTCRTT